MGKAGRPPVLANGERVIASNPKFAHTVPQGGSELSGSKGALVS